MKTIFIATLLSVGVLLRPEMVPTVGETQTIDQITFVGITHQSQSFAAALTDTEMAAVQGGGFAECHAEIDANGNTYVSCCLDFWLFRLCFEMNWTAITNLLPF